MMYVIVFLVSSITAVSIGLVFILLQRRDIKREIAVKTIVNQLRKEISELIVELNGTTERNILLVENRIRELKQLVDKASKLHKVFEIEKNKQAKTEQVYSELSRKRPIMLQASTPFTNIDESTDFDLLSLRDKALWMYQRGDSPEIIADKLGMKRGEIELIVSLSNQNPANT